MVLIIIFLDLRTEALLDKEVLQQFVIGLAVVLITDPFIHSCLMRSLLSLRKISFMGLPILPFFPSSSAPLDNRLTFFLRSIKVLILL